MRVKNQTISVKKLPPVLSKTKFKIVDLNGTAYIALIIPTFIQF